MNPWLVLGGAIAGAVVGSFLATLCIRWPEGRSVMRGRSTCDDCSRQIEARDLIPIVSSARLSGRCRHCGARISSLHTKVEVGAAVLGAFAQLILPGLPGAALASLWWLLLILAILDARHFWLPDRLTILLAIAGLALGGLLWGLGLEHRLIGMAAGFAALWLVAAGYRLVRGRDGLGGGDPKLLGAIGAWLGWAALPVVVLISAAIGLSIALARRQGRFNALPFGTFLAAGAILWSAVVLLLPRFANAAY